MKRIKTILVVDDEEFIRLTLENIFSEENYNVISVGSGNEAVEIVKNNDIDLALLDVNLPDIDGIEVLKRLKEIQPDLLVIVATGYASVESAIDAIKLGAYDYIKKPFKADAIKLITKLALETQTLKRTVKQLKANQPTLYSIDDITGNSDKINQIKHQLEEFAKVDASTVLIVGESGSGKELMVQSIHSLSPRADNNFVEINCASIPGNLLESELFGYVKGAFTDAKESKVGLIEKAAGGTLFLDEIGEMSMSLQATLLRVLENKKVRRLGSTEDIEIDVRIIAATNRNLREAIAQKEFREDLYYRLNVLTIQVPPLRKRKEDIPLLINYFREIFNNKFNRQIESFSDEALSIMQNYSWPGNVRELKNSIERMCILHKDKIIESYHLPEELLSEHQIALENDSASMSISDEVDFEKIVRDKEIELLTNAYLQCDKNSSKAARMLKIPRETFRYKIAKYKIPDGEY